MWLVTRVNNMRVRHYFESAGHNVFFTGVNSKSSTLISTLPQSTSKQCPLLIYSRILFSRFSFMTQSFKSKLHTSRAWYLNVANWKSRISGTQLVLKSSVHYAAEIWKRIFISTVSLPLTLIRHGNGAFLKRSSDRKIKLKTRLFVFVWTGTFWKRSVFFFKNVEVTIITWHTAGVLLKHKSKMTAHCYVLKFLRRCVNGNHLMR